MRFAIDVAGFVHLISVPENIQFNGTFEHER